MSEPYEAEREPHAEETDTVVDAELDAELDQVGVEVPLLAAQSAPPADAAGQLELPALPQTGDPRVDDALARLTELEALPVEEHLPVYRDVHRRLHETLADLDVG